MILALKIKNFRIICGSEIYHTRHWNLQNHAFSLAPIAPHRVNRGATNKHFSSHHADKWRHADFYPKDFGDYRGADFDYAVDAKYDYRLYKNFV